MARVGNGTDPLTRSPGRGDINLACFPYPGTARQVMECDLVAISLLDLESGQFRIYALDFPNGRGFVHEELVTPHSGATMRAFETLKPVIVNQFDPAELGPEASQILLGEGLKTLCIPSSQSRTCNWCI